MTAHAIESRAVLAQDAEVTAKLLQNLGPVLEALQPTQDAIVRVGAVLIVKENGRVTVRQLTAAEQLSLDHAPHVQASPAETLRVLGQVENAARHGHTHLELTGGSTPDFPDLPEPHRFQSARIVECSYRTFAPLARLTGLAYLHIVSYPDETLEPIGCLTQLEELSILHLPRVTELAPLKSLTSLRRLDLIARSGLKRPREFVEVASLAPLCALPRLEVVNLIGVRPHDQRVDDLLKCPALRIAKLDGYPRIGGHAPSTGSCRSRLTTNTFTPTMTAIASQAVTSSV